MKLGYKTEGTGKTQVVVMHDIGGDHRNYDAMLPYIDGETFRYTFVDFRGYGLSKGVKGHYNLEEAVGDLIDTIDALEYETVHLVCHSMSGMIAQKAALTHPKRIASIVGVAPVLASGFQLDEGSAVFMMESFRSEEAIYDMLISYRDAGYTQKWYQFKSKRWWECSNPEAVCGYFKMITTNNFEEEAKQLETPLLLILGKNDLAWFQEDFMRNSFAGNLPNIEIKTIENASHYAMQETPVLCASMIEEFVNSHLYSKV